jgi:hypothetical protein
LEGLLRAHVALAIFIFRLSFKDSFLNMAFCPAAVPTPWTFPRHTGLEMYTVSCATSRLLPRPRASFSRRVGFGQDDGPVQLQPPRRDANLPPSSRASCFGIVSPGARSRAAAAAPCSCSRAWLRRCAPWCTCSPGRLNLLGIFLRHHLSDGRWSTWTSENSLMNNPFYFSLNMTIECETHSRAAPGRKLPGIGAS